MRRPLGSSPAIIVHADWSVDPRKRWVCCATRGKDGGYSAAAPTPVGDLNKFLNSLQGRSRYGGSALAGFDFPLGLPIAYAEQAGIDSFVAALREFGSARWASFYDVADRPKEISLARPFFPNRPGRKGEFARSDLARGLNVSHFDDLLRQVDRPTADRPPASVLFWTLGGKQVGKATITGWRDLLVPAINGGDLDVALWPFDGTFEDCLKNSQITIVEAYPAEYYRHLGLPIVDRGSKRNQASRIESGVVMIAWARRFGLRLSAALRRALRDGFGAHPDGEDPFDAVVGTFGLVNVVLGHRPAFDPPDTPLHAVEGWTLGQQL